MRKMLKNITVLAIVSVMVLGFSITAMANTNVQPQQGNGWGFCGGRGAMNGLMWNEDGTFMSREAFEARLDELISAGIILESDRAFFLERFDLCSTYGAGATGVRGACGGNGRGMGAGRGLGFRN